MIAAVLTSKRLAEAYRLGFGNMSMHGFRERKEFPPTLTTFASYRVILEEIEIIICHSDMNDIILLIRTQHECMNVVVSLPSCSVQLILRSR